MQSHKTEALAGKLSAVYGVMGTPDFIKQKQSHVAHKSQVRQHFICCIQVLLSLHMSLHHNAAVGPSTVVLHDLRPACRQTGLCIRLPF